MRILGGAAAAVTAHLAPGRGPAAGLQAPKTVILRARLSELVVPGEGHWQTAGMAQWCRRRVWWRPSWQERCAAGCVCPSPGQCAGVGHRLHGGGVELRRWTAKVAGGEDGWPLGAGVMPMSGGGWGPWPEASARGQALSPALTSQHLLSPSSVSLSSRFCTGTSPDGRGSGGTREVAQGHWWSEGSGSPAVEAPCWARVTMGLARGAAGSRSAQDGPGAQLLGWVWGGARGSRPVRTAGQVCAHTCLGVKSHACAHPRISRQRALLRCPGWGGWAMWVTNRAKALERVPPGLTFLVPPAPAKLPAPDLDARRAAAPQALRRWERRSLPKK